LRRLCSFFDGRFSGRNSPSYRTKRRPESGCTNRLSGGGRTADRSGNRTPCDDRTFGWFGIKLLSLEKETRTYTTDKAIGVSLLKSHEDHQEPLKLHLTFAFLCLLQITLVSLVHFIAG
jgi:hypothetical protein